MDTKADEIPLDKIFRAAEIPCEVRHPLILRLWDLTPVNDYFVIENDHDPVPLRMQFQARFSGCFSWEYLDRGPKAFRIKITRLRGDPSGS